MDTNYVDTNNANKNELSRIEWTRIKRIKCAVMYIYDYLGCGFTTSTGIFTLWRTESTVVP